MQGRVETQAKKKSSNSWEAYYDNGREKSGEDAVMWAQKAERLGAGEILITSVDKEGAQKGIDIDLVSKIRETVNIPIIYSGGVGELEQAAAMEVDR